MQKRIHQLTSLLILSLLLSARVALSEDRCAKALKEAQAIRGLSARKTVECQSISKEKFIALSTHLIMSDTDEENLSHHQEVLYRQGLIPKSYDYARCIAPALATNGAAFYSWKLGFIVVPDWITTPSVILMHEAIHALQDQHYGVKRFASKKFIFDDENMAQGAILEGDAFSGEEIFLKKYPEEPADPDINGKPELVDSKCELPGTLSEIFDRMYQDGGDYVKALRTTPTKFEAVFKKPVSSTRAIVEKSVRDIPRQLTCALPATVVAGRIGVFGVEAFLRSRGVRKDASIIANGMKEDCFSESKDHRYVAKYRFDTPALAQRFLEVTQSYWSKEDPAFLVLLTKDTVELSSR